MRPQNACIAIIISQTLTEQRNAVIVKVVRVTIGCSDIFIVSEWDLLTLVYLCNNGVIVTADYCN